MVFAGIELMAFMLLVKIGRQFKHTWLVVSAWIPLLLAIYIFVIEVGKLSKH